MRRVGVIRKGLLIISTALAAAVLLVRAANVWLDAVGVSMAGGALEIFITQPIVVSDDIADGFLSSLDPTLLGGKPQEERKLDIFFVFFRTFLHPMSWRASSAHDWKREISLGCPLWLLVVLFTSAACVSLVRSRQRRHRSRTSVTVTLSFLALLSLLLLVANIWLERLKLSASSGRLTIVAMHPIQPWPEVIETFAEDRSPFQAMRYVDLNVFTITSYVLPTQPMRDFTRDWLGVVSVECHWAVVLVLLASYPIVSFIRGPLRRWRRRRKGLCVRCGYNLTGNTSGVCPECGVAV
jgi:hypothetical protein